MAFEWFMIVAGWLSLFLFIVVAAYKISRIAAQPLNLRWEVYPIPHETGDRRQRGSSYMEEVDWVTRPRAGSPIGELLEMGSEIFLLKRVREHNPYHLWLPSMALHWGLYFGAAWIFLLAVENLLQTTALAALTLAVGVGGFALGAFGCVALVVKRATNAELNLYTVPADYFNVLFLAAIFGLGLVSWLAEPAFAAHRAYVGSVLFFKPTPVPFVVTLAFLLFESFLIYMPFTKLIHYIGKHFTFHALGDDAFKPKDSAADKKVREQLGYVVTWSAPHVAPGKTWLEQVRMTAPEESAKK